MPTITKFANSNGVASGTPFTNPQNAYLANGLFATVTSTAKNTTVSEHEWGFPGITTQEIPDGSTIDAVRCIGRVGLTGTGTNVLIGLNGVANNSVDNGVEQTHTDANLTVLTYSYNTIPNLADLRTAGFYEASVRYRRGNTTASITAQVDYLQLEIDYTPPAGPDHFPRTASDTSAIGADTAGRTAELGRGATDSTSTSEDVVGTVEQAGGQDFPRAAVDTVAVTDEAEAEVRGPSQFITAVADIDTDGWAGEDGRSTNLYPSISDNNAATYIRSPQAPGPADAATFGIESAIDPETHLGHIVRYWYSGQGSVTLVVDLLEGSTLIASWQHVDPPDTPQQAVQTLSTAEAAAITNYADLRVRFRGA